MRKRWGRREGKTVNGGGSLEIWLYRCVRERVPPHHARATSGIARSVSPSGNVDGEFVSCVCVFLRIFESPDTVYVSSIGMFPAAPGRVSQHSSRAQRANERSTPAICEISRQMASHAKHEKKKMKQSPWTTRPRAFLSFVDIPSKRRRFDSFLHTPPTSRQIIITTLKSVTKVDARHRVCGDQSVTLPVR